MIHNIDQSIRLNNNPNTLNIVGQGVGVGARDGGLTFEQT